MAKRRKKDEDCSFIENLSHDELKKEFRKLWAICGKELKSKMYFFDLVNARNAENHQLEERIKALEAEVQRCGGNPAVGK